jgi:hypothetical protein
MLPIQLAPVRPRETRKRHRGRSIPEPSSHPFIHLFIHPLAHSVHPGATGRDTDRTLISEVSIHLPYSVHPLAAARGTEIERERETPGRDTDAEKSGAQRCCAAATSSSESFLRALSSRHCSRIRRSPRLLASRGAVNVRGSSHPDPCAINHCTRIM